MRGLLGVCVWEILSFGVKPFTGLTNTDVMRRVAGGERLSRPAVCPLTAYRLLLDCWMTDPVLRPTFAVLKPRLRYT
ncbi:unnamed protein product [Protopolystoma xenopodis]|uniref:Serine-threonine/tyrosine-protein kinase catalytic domain-containing protein n=1 Tax=Protopolystoma xenopodis TaxID=117903 RepID=A0A448WW02_9PLAT|nr:unnamed protein product [Protopolystoma xenopodis]